MNPLKTRTGADFNGSLTSTSHVLLDILQIIVIVFFLSIQPQHCLAQDQHSTAAASPAPCRQYFLLKTTKKMSISEGAKIDSTFMRQGFTRSTTDVLASTIRLTCPKGCTLKDVKAVLDLLELETSAIKEEYTNKPTPTIFE